MVCCPYATTSICINIRFLFYYYYYFLEWLRNFIFILFLLLCIFIVITLLTFAFLHPNFIVYTIFFSFNNIVPFFFLTDVFILQEISRYGQVNYTNFYLFIDFIFYIGCQLWKHYFYYLTETAYFLHHFFFNFFFWNVLMM